MERSPERLQIGTGEFTIDELRISDIARYPGPVVEAGREPLPNRADRRFPVIEEPTALSFDASAGATAGSRFEIAISHPTQEPPRTRQRPRGPSTLSISSARGESEPAKLVLYAFEDIGGVKVRLQPPVDLPGLTLDVRRVSEGADAPLLPWAGRRDGERCSPPGPTHRTCTFRRVSFASSGSPSAYRLMRSPESTMEPSRFRSQALHRRTFRSRSRSTPSRSPMCPTSEWGCTTCPADA